MLAFTIFTGLWAVQSFFYGFRYRNGKSPYPLYPEYPKNFISEADLPQYTLLIGLSHYLGGIGSFLACVLSCFVSPSFVLLIPLLIGLILELSLCVIVKKKYGRCSLLY